MLIRLIPGEVFKAAILSVVISIGLTLKLKIIPENVAVFWVYML